jgi:hypothetical protein
MWAAKLACSKMSLSEREKRKWKWRDPKTNKGKIAPENWLNGKHWLEIVESAHGFATSSG